MLVARWVSSRIFGVVEFSRRGQVPYAVITVTKGLRYRWAIELWLASRFVLTTHADSECSRCLAGRS
jgi:hypothetical protein